jgi:hypothetical protein
MRGEEKNGDMRRNETELNQLQKDTTRTRGRKNRK